MKGRTLLLMLCIALSFTSCEKDDLVKPVSPAVLAVRLHAPYLGASEVDSAFAIWKIEDAVHRIKLLTRNDSLLCSLDSFPEGTGELQIHIYSNKKYSNQYPGQWLLKKNVTVAKQSAFNLAGPQSFQDQNWFPRVALSDAVGHRAVIALRPDDAYFFVSDPGHDLYSLTIDRGYWKTKAGIALAGRDVWKCTQSCTGIADEEFFRSLPGRIGNKPWNHISIAILFEINSEGEGWVLSLEHEP